jgi:hypothetical protein
MQKTYLFPLQKGEPLANASKIYVLLPTIGKEGDVLSRYIGKWDIYCSKV